MTNESIFYIIGLILGAILGYAISGLASNKQAVKIEIRTENSDILKEFAERVKLEFYREFDEIIPSVMADKIDEIAEEMSDGKM